MADLILTAEALALLNRARKAGFDAFRRQVEGTSWEEVSPDLTRNDPSKLVASGGPITKDNTGAEVYCTIMKPGTAVATQTDGRARRSCSDLAFSRLRILWTP